MVLQAIHGSIDGAPHESHMTVSFKSWKLHQVQRLCSLRRRQGVHLCASVLDFGVKIVILVFIVTLWILQNHNGSLVKRNIVHSVLHREKWNAEVQSHKY